MTLAVELAIKFYFGCVDVYFPIIVDVSFKMLMMILMLVFMMVLMLMLMLMLMLL